MPAQVEDVGVVVANDMDPVAVAAIQRNKAFAGAAADKVRRELLRRCGCCFAAALGRRSALCGGSMQAGTGHEPLAEAAPAPGA